MEILNEYTNKREGNECLITTYICLIKLNYSLYMVTFTEEVYGGWTGNPVTTKCEMFRDYNIALDYMDKLKKN